MTADERIEKLLNHFGQTISDLPKPNRIEWAYSSEQIKKALNTATEWSAIPFISGNGTGDYICHLADVIDRMEVALETALSCCYCGYCAHATEEEDSVDCNDCIYGVYGEESKFRVRDEEFTEYDEWLLTDRSEDEHDHPSEG